MLTIIKSSPWHPWPSPQCVHLILLVQWSGLCLFLLPLLQKVSCFLGTHEHPVLIYYDNTEQDLKVRSGGRSCHTHEFCWQTYLNIQHVAALRSDSEYCVHAWVNESQTISFSHNNSRSLCLFQISWAFLWADSPLYAFTVPVTRVQVLSTLYCATNKMFKKNPKIL